MDESINGKNPNWQRVNYPEPGKVKKFYQDAKVAERYDSIRFSGLRGKLVHRLEERMLRKAMKGKKKGTKVLDLPCGTGRLFGAFKPGKIKVIGVDVSEEMISVARRNYGGDKFSYMVADAKSLPLEEGSVDYVTSFRFMAHFPPEDRSQILREMARVSKDALFINFHVAGTSLLWLVKRIFNKQALPAYKLTLKQLRKEVEAAGLKIVRRIYMTRFIFDSELVELRKK